MQSIDHYMPITQAKAGLLDLVRRVRNNDNAIAITRNGVPEAVVISLERFDGLLETIEILSDTKSMGEIKRSLDEAAKGDWIEVGDILGDA